MSGGTDPIDKDPDDDGINDGDKLPVVQIHLMMIDADGINDGDEEAGGSIHRQ